MLIVEDHAETQFIYEKFLQGSRFQPLPARTLREAEDALVRVRPHAIILDILLPGRDTWTFLATLKSQDTTQDIPVLVATTVDDHRKGWALGADAYAIKPITRAWLLGELQQRPGSRAGPMCWSLMMKPWRGTSSPSVWLVRRMSSTKPPRGLKGVSGRAVTVPR